MRDNRGRAESDESDDRDERDSRRHRRSRSRQDDDSRSAGRDFDHDELRTIASHQKMLLFCILFQVGLGVAAGAFKEEKLGVFFLIGALATGIVGAIFIFLLAMQVYSSAVGTILGILTLIPLIGLIVLLIVNQKATNILKSNGVRVGLLGAKNSDLEALRRRRGNRRHHDDDDNDDDDADRREGVRHPRR